jgi:hypothetical protein
MLLAFGVDVAAKPGKPAVTSAASVFEIVDSLTREANPSLAQIRRILGATDADSAASSIEIPAGKPLKSASFTPFSKDHQPNYPGGELFLTLDSPSTRESLTAADVTKRMGAGKSGRTEGGGKSELEYRLASCHVVFLFTGNDVSIIIGYLKPPNR